MATDAALLECPMCDFTVLPSDDYILQLHFEQLHTTDSPFMTENDPRPHSPALSRSSSKRKHGRDTPSSDDEEDTVVCPEPDCGEVVPLTDFNEHLDYHAAETLSFDETTGKYHSHHSTTTMHSLAADQYSHTGISKDFYEDNHFTTDLPEALRRHDGHGRKTKKHRERRNTSSSEKTTLSRSILTFNPFTKSDKSIKPPYNSGRLGKNELGPYAWENRMPKWLYDQLEAGPKVTVANRIGRDGRLVKQEQVQNETPGIIPILAQLSALDRAVQEAYYCHPSTLHIGKTPKEGGFCGYRNMQMLLSYIQGSKAQGHEEFPGRTPGILKLQDLIERAWNKGINQIGRVQTGGIRGTRKYIGTPEAQAFFLSSEINCAVEMFTDAKERKIEAHELLLDAIERYFGQAAVKDGSNVYKTLLPPIYLQQPGHSITIIGFERRRDGSCNLMVFDPMYSTSPAMHKLLGRKNIRHGRPEVMHAYRRGARPLKKYNAFEILMLTATPPLFPAWDVLRQFPDCRFVYAFFRARTLGYDVYPEDWFLPNFPWQQYGGLWVCDEARFARAETVNALTAQALRRITGEGSSSRASNSPTSPTSPFTCTSFHQLPAASAHMREEMYTQLPSFVPSLDGSMSDHLTTVQPIGSGRAPKLNSAQNPLPQPEAMRPNLSLWTDIDRKYPGFFSPISPTKTAKDLFPSPLSETASGASTPRAFSLTVRSMSPMSIDGSEMCGPSRRCASHGYAHYAGTSMGLIDSVIAGGNNSPRTPSTASLSPISPPRTLSPRSAMLKNMVNKQAFQSLSHQPPTSPTSRSSFSPPPPTIEISNGTESSLASPISPSGMVLAYTSHRPVSSGLLGVRPLSETQVAEYRFWRPCGRRVCAFGCGGAHEGEWAAAKRLFREVEDVVSDDHGDSSGDGETEVGIAFGYDGQSDRSINEEKGRMEEAKWNASVWAGGRLVNDWSMFLGGCDREGVARY